MGRENIDYPKVVGKRREVWQEYKNYKLEKLEREEKG